jgi:hypothetical protein
MTVSVEGNYLEYVIGVQVIREGKPIPGISAKLVQPWPASRNVELQALNALIGTGYQLRFATKVESHSEQFDVPVAIFSVNVSPQFKPDLAVKAVTIDPPNPNNRDGFVVRATIVNQGRGDAFLPRGWSLAASRFSGWRPNDFYGFPLDDNLTLPALASKEVVAYGYRSSEKAVAGTWTITVRADPDKQIDETNEDNNEISLTVVVTDLNPPPPATPGDLIITDVRLDPAEATTAGNFQVVALIKNQGGIALILPHGWEMLREQGDHLKPDAGMSMTDRTLQPGGTMELRGTPQKLQVGTFTWTLVVDPMMKVAEANEQNNTKSFQVTIKAQ